jgi:hypothetical protein
MAFEKLPHGMRTATEEAVAGYISGMNARGELLPGGEKELLEQTAARRHANPEAALIFLHELLDTRCRGLLNPEAESTYESEIPLKSVLRRMPLRPGVVDKLYAELAVPLQGIPASHLPGYVWTMLCQPQHRHHLATSQLDFRESQQQEATARVRTALEKVRNYIHRGVNLDALAAEWAPDLARKATDDDLLRAVVARLQQPALARSLTVDGMPAAIPITSILQDMKSSRPLGDVEAENLRVARGQLGIGSSPPQERRADPLGGFRSTI